MSQLHFVDACTQRHFSDMSLLHALGWRAAYRDAIPADYLSHEVTDRRWVSTFRANHTEGRYQGLLLYDKGLPLCCATFGPARVDLADRTGPICTLFSPDLTQYGEILSLYGRPEHWGRGYGSMVIEEVLHRLRSQGYPGCFLYVLRENDRARRFYEKHGFFWDGHSTVVSLRPDTVLTELRYIREL